MSTSMLLLSLAPYSHSMSTFRDLQGEPLWSESPRLKLSMDMETPNKREHPALPLQGQH